MKQQRVLSRRLPNRHQDIVQGVSIGVAHRSDRANRDGWLLIFGEYDASILKTKLSGQLSIKERDTVSAAPIQNDLTAPRLEEPARPHEIGQAVADLVAGRKRRLVEAADRKKKKKKKRSAGGPRLFVSHASADSTLVAALVALLKAAFFAKTGDLNFMCTSDPGHTIETGSDTPGTIAKKIEASSGLVVLVTPASLHSQYVMYELGAAGARGQRIAPVVASGARFEDLPGALSNRSAVDGTKPDRVWRLLKDLEKWTGWTQRQPAMVSRAVEDFVLAAGELRSALGLQESVRDLAVRRFAFKPQDPS